MEVSVFTSHKDGAEGLIDDCTMLTALSFWCNECTKLNVPWPNPRQNLASNQWMCLEHMAGCCGQSMFFGHDCRATSKEVRTTCKVLFIWNVRENAVLVSSAIFFSLWWCMRCAMWKVLSSLICQHDFRKDSDQTIHHHKTVFEILSCLVLLNDFEMPCRSQETSTCEKQNNFLVEESGLLVHSCWVPGPSSLPQCGARACRAVGQLRCISGWKK